MIADVRSEASDVLSETPTDLVAMGRAARGAAAALARLDGRRRRAAVLAMADALEAATSEVVAANALDVAEAEGRGIGPALLDRLALDSARLRTVVAGVRDVAGLPDPVGRELQSERLPNGMGLKRVAVPLGVVGAIYEARPNVTADIAALCVKTGNAALLRGGSETLRSNVAMVAALRAGLAAAGAPGDALQLVADSDRALVERLLRLDEFVDMIVPRGGRGLHALCREKSTIPVMTGGIGICHVYVDASARLNRAVPVIENAKVQRPTVCNALDTLLVHEAVAHDLLPAVDRALAPHGVELVVDRASGAILEAAGGACTRRPAGPGDFDQEWLGLTLGIRVVGGLGEAVAHIRDHSTRHSDAILTETAAHADAFVRDVDSAAVYVNASTRFTDGGEFGLGAEVAVSTQKLHARGPMGLESLTTYKWVGVGDYHVRA